MERPLIPEVVEKRAKAVINELSDNLKTLDSRFDSLRSRVTGLDWRVSPDRLREMKEKILRETGEMATKAREYAEESYSSGLERLGVATKEDVEALRRKLSSMQRRVRELSKSLREEKH